MPLETGQFVGDYEILGELGAGGMGRVYKVRSAITQRIEAMKVLLDDLALNSDLGERFIREIRISAALDHPNIACLRSAQQIDRQFLMIMEFVDGSTLSQLTQSSSLALPRSLDYIRQALSGLEYAHAHNVIHRDIKPGNIMVTKADQVKLMDFGVAKLTTDAALTKAGFLVGSLYYLSPEVFDGGVPDARSDIYAMGVTLYQLVTGKRPFEGQSESQIIAAHLRGRPVPPQELDPAVPASVNEIILTALARDPQRRFASAKAMRVAIESVIQGSSALTTPATVRPTANPAAAIPPAIVLAPRKSHRAIYMLAGSVATLAIVVGAAIELPNWRPTHADTNMVKTPQLVPSPPAASIPLSQPASAKVIPAPAVADVKIAPAPPAVAAVTHKTFMHPEAQSPHPQPAPVHTDMPAPDQPAAPAAAPSFSPQAVSVDLNQMADLRDRFSQLDARASAVQASLDNLRRAQAQAGVGLRGDMAAAEQRLISLMRQINAELQQNDAAAAQRNLDRAEAETEKLERFLGR